MRPMLPRSRDIACALALTVAGTFWLRAVRVPLPPRGPDMVENLDPRFESLRKALPDHARVGLLLPTDPFSSDPFSSDPALYYVAQYALAPLLVHRVIAGDCVTHGAKACGAEQLDFFIVEGPQQAKVAGLETQLGLGPVAAAEGLLLRRRQP
jgi:hypothetical protein